MKYSHPPNYLKRIKESRTRFGITPQRMAELRGLSFASVSRWENGQTRPSSLTWQRITHGEVLGVEALLKDYVVDKKPTHILINI